jgi:hypothetical protein
MQEYLSSLIVRLMACDGLAKYNLHSFWSLAYYFDGSFGVVL